jgi:hypothetical protein
MSKEVSVYDIDCFDSKTRKFKISAGYTLLNFIKNDPITISKRIYKNILQNLNIQGVLDEADYLTVIQPLIKTHPYYQNYDVDECRRIIICACIFFLRKRSEKLAKLKDNSNEFQLHYRERQIEDYLRTFINDTSKFKFNLKQFIIPKTQELSLEMISLRRDVVSLSIDNDDFSTYCKAYRYAKNLLKNVIRVC